MHAAWSSSCCFKSCCVELLHGACMNRPACMLMVLQQQQQQLLLQKLLRACVLCVATCVMKIGEDCLWQ